MKLILKIILLLIMNMRIHVIALLLFNINCLATGDFTHTLDLAKYSSCKDVAKNFQKTPLLTKVAHPEYSLGEGCPIGRGGSLLSKLKALSSSPFPWRFEITNGYQEGFVYNALLGYSSEQNGDIPFAYRCYQNSLAYIDEEKSFDYPLPKTEIYLAIGRTCLAANRYMDAKDWLDNAFFEAGNNKQLQAAIDRVLIQRANELGDYQEIIFLYQHLENLANQKAPRLDKEGCPQGGVVNSPFSKVEHPGFTSGVGKGDLNSPPVLGDTSRVLPRGGAAQSAGVVERTTDHGLRTTDYANYAQILFYSRKDREGFSKLLAGISKLGIDNNLGVKDPLIDKFLNNIMRADDDEVKWFYDLLGWAIVDARAKAGDENYLAFLCNARTLFCKVYDFLNPEDDLKKVKERIDVVKEQLAQGFNPFGNESKLFVNRYSLIGKKKIFKSTNLKISKSGEMEKTPGIILEDLLMLADWKLKRKDYKSAETNYFFAYQMATDTFANMKYDGTTAKNAAIMGLLMINRKSQIENPKFFDNSYHAAETTLILYLAATNDEQRAEYDTEVAMTILSLNHKLIKRYIKQLGLRCTYKSFYIRKT